MSGILNSPSPVVPAAHRDAPSAAVRTERRPSAHLAWPKAKDGPSRTPSSQEQWMPEILEVRSKKQNLVRRCVRTTPSTGDSMGQIIRAPTSAERRNCKSRVEKTRGGNSTSRQMNMEYKIGIGYKELERTIPNAMESNATEGLTAKATSTKKSRPERRSMRGRTAKEALRRREACKRGRHKRKAKSGLQCSALCLPTEPTEHVTAQSLARPCMQPKPDHDQNLSVTGAVPSPAVADKRNHARTNGVQEYTASDKGLHSWRT